MEVSTQIDARGLNKRMNDRMNCENQSENEAMKMDLKRHELISHEKATSKLDTLV